MAEAQEFENLAYLQYRNSSLIAFNNTGYANVPLDLDTDSKPNNKFTKVNDNDFRVDFDGYIKAGFKALPRENGFVFDSLVVAAIFINGTIIPSSQCTMWMDDDDETTSANYSVIWPVSNGDIINFRALSLNGDDNTFPADAFLGWVELKSEN